MTPPTVALPPGLTLYFARHGQTQANVARQFSGKKNTPLTAMGREQAHEVGLVLKRELGAATGIHFVCSPLQRACTTMEIARQAMGLAPHDYVTDARLQEIDLGQWDQLTEDQARSLDPAYYDRRKADKWDIPALGGENYAQVAARMTSWLGDLKTDTFAVSHGAATRILRGLFAGLDAATMSALDEPQGVVFRARGTQVEMLTGTGGAVSNPGSMG